MGVSAAQPLPHGPHSRRARTPAAAPGPARSGWRVHRRVQDRVRPRLAWHVGLEQEVRHGPTATGKEPALPALAGKALDSRGRLTPDHSVPPDPGDLVRPYASTDGPAVVALVVAAGMFSEAEAAFLAEGALDDSGDGAACFVQDGEDGQGLASVLYYRPEEAADLAYDVTMIAVRPDLQGGGRGAALMRYAEADLRQRGQRLLIVRTSGTDQYSKTRAFYRGLGYTEQTRVADYWTDGDDLVLFTKRLDADTQRTHP